MSIYKTIPSLIYFRKLSCTFWICNFKGMIKSFAYRTAGLLLLILLMTHSACSEEDTPPPYALTLSEGFINPIGFYEPTPSFSWKLPASGRVFAQSAYAIVVASDPKLLPDSPDIWHSGKVHTDQSVWVPYEGEPLTSREKVYWQVKYWDQEGKASDWSEVAHFEMGLLTNTDWDAVWIGYPYAENQDTTEHGTIIYEPQYLRKELNLSSDIVSARLYISAKGAYEAQINGKKVGDDIMPPGYTPYDKRIETLTYDVTDMLHPGENAVGIILAPAWHSGRMGWTRTHWIKKDPPRVICQLAVILEDGSQETYYSDETWRAMINGPIRFSEIYDGEIYDANKEMPGWSKAGYPQENWKRVMIEEIDPSVKLEPKRHQPVRDIKALNTISVSQLESGAVIFDLGQNIVGVPKINVPMTVNDTLTIRFAEILQQDGQLYTENYRTAKSIGYYIANKTGIAEFKPKFTFYGFRYVELSGFDSSAVPDKSWVKGFVQHSDFDVIGTFSSSHETLNQLQSNIEWGLRGNFYDIPTDCPQRDERAGWTGDAQVFAPTSYYIADVHSFWMSWLQSVREEQFENGAIPIVVPNITRDRISPGWGDAATIIPWAAYIRTGDKKILKDNFAMMKQWVGFYQSNAKNNIVDMFGFGDWLQPYSSGGNRGDTSMDIIATAFYAQSIRLTMKAAGVLGYEQDELELKALLNKVRSSFEETFFEADGRIKDRNETQTAYLLAIGFNLLSDEMTEKAIPHLLSQIEEADNHLRTGFLGTPLLAPVLDKIGQIGLMYEILFKETYPSWFYSINQGATTMWERWNSYSHEDGFGDAGMNSFNHYAYGAIGQWMYERIAGISPLEPGYKRIRIAPEPGGPLTSAKGTYESPYGRILSEWQLKNDEFSLCVIIPPNTTAEIVTPAITRDDIMIARNEISAIKGVAKTEIHDDRIIIEVIPGTYNFLTPYLNINQDEVELYDLLEDPFETNDISNENPEKVNEMKSQLNDFVRSIAESRGGADYD